MKCCKGRRLETHSLGILKAVVVVKAEGVDEMSSGWSGKVAIKMASSYGFIGLGRCKAVILLVGWQTVLTVSFM